MERIPVVIGGTGIRMDYDIVGGLSESLLLQLKDRLFSQLRDVAMPPYRQLFNDFNTSAWPQTDSGTTSCTFEGDVVIVDGPTLKVSLTITLNFNDKNAPEMARIAMAMLASGFTHITHHLENILRTTHNDVSKVETAA